MPPLQPSQRAARRTDRRAACAPRGRRAACAPGDHGWRPEVAALVAAACPSSQSAAANCRAPTVHGRGEAPPWPAAPGALTASPRSGRSVRPGRRCRRRHLAVNVSASSIGQGSSVAILVPGRAAHAGRSRARRPGGRDEGDPVGGRVGQPGVVAAVARLGAGARLGQRSAGVLPGLRVRARHHAVLIGAAQLAVLLGEREGRRGWEQDTAVVGRIVALVQRPPRGSLRTTSRSRLPPGPSSS